MNASPASQKLKNEHLKLLQMLSGCPDGATSYALMTLHQFQARTIADLARMGHVRIYHQLVGNGYRMKPIPVTRLFITELGRGQCA